MTPVAGPLLRRSLARDVTRHYWHNCLTKRQARALTLALLTPSGDRLPAAVIALSAAKGWTRDACAPELTRMLLDLAPAYTGGLWDALRRHTAELADTQAQISSLEADPDVVDAYIDGPVHDRDGYRDDVLATLRANAAHLRAERITEARWLAGFGSNGSALAVSR